MQLLISVPGTPQAKGSRTQIGKVNIEAGTNLSRKRKKAWRDAVEREATEAMLASRPQTSDIYPVATFCKVTAYFYFPIPKSRTKGKQRISAGAAHIQKPDCDKLLRATLDPLKESGILKDDCVASQLVGEKIWCEAGYERAEITITF